MNNMKIGWLSPSGDLWECSTFDHIAKADEIIDKYRYPTLQYRASDEALLANGWVHISISQLTHEYRIWWNNFLTMSQKNFLKKYFENEEIKTSPLDKIKWDKEMN